MCRPTFFDVSYVINPWMVGNVNAVSSREAKRQWAALRNAIAKNAQVKLVPPQPGMPDMPFTANAGVLLGDNVVLSRFRFRERQAEEPHFEKCFERNDFQVHKVPEDIPFEGAGDALIDRGMPLLWFGTGHRSDIRALPYLRDFLEVTVQPLILTDPRFYHLDTCFCPLSGGYLLYYPSAFDALSLRAIYALVPPEFRIPVEERDALHFACNAVNVVDEVILNRASMGLQQQLSECGFRVTEIGLSEFMRSGGAAKCLTLRLDEPRK